MIGKYRLQIVYYAGVAKMSCQNGDIAGSVGVVTTTSKTPSFDTPEDKPSKANKVKTNYNACIQIS
jgi:hypothetical protein